MGFYLFEKLINIVQTWRSRRRLTVRKMSPGEGEEKPPRIVLEGHEVSDRVRGEARCLQKYSSYCVADLQPGPVSVPRNNNSVAAAEYQQKDNGEKVIVSQHEVGGRGESHHSSVLPGCSPRTHACSLPPSLHPPQLVKRGLDGDPGGRDTQSG